MPLEDVLRRGSPRVELTALRKDLREWISFCCAVRRRACLSCLDLSDCLDWPDVRRLERDEDRLR